MTLNIVVPRFEAIPRAPAPRSAALAAAYQWGAANAVGLNIITSLNGSLTDASGLSHGLSNPTDRGILTAIRAHADVIVVGAATARAEQYSSPRGAALALVTQSGDLRNLALRAGETVIALAPPGRSIAADPGVVVKHVPIPDSAGTDISGANIPRIDASGIDAPGIDAPGIVRSLYDAGYSRVLFEGGGVLAAAVAGSAALTDLFLSLSPQLLDRGIGWLAARERDDPAHATRLHLRHVIHDTEHDALYLRWSRMAKA